MNLYSLFKSQNQEDNFPQFITIDGKLKKNKWKIPDLLNNEEKKILKKVKKKAYQLDDNFCGCFIGLDPLIGKNFLFYLLTLNLKFIKIYTIKDFYLLLATFPELFYLFV